MTTQHSEAFLAAKALFDSGKMKESIAAFLPLAEAGDAQAQYYLSMSYYDLDEYEAFAWCKKSAENGFVSAQFTLGNMYIDEWGTEEDDDELYRWWKLAAENGHPEAQFRFAMLLQSLGDTEGWRQWLQKSRESGYEDE